MKKVVIIGGGPAGLTAAYELLEAGGFEVTLLEESEVFGGISRTVDSNGNRMDIGGHRFFSKDTRVTDWWAKFVRPQGKLAKDQILLGTKVDLVEGGADPESEDLVMLERIRVSRIYYRNAFFDYPVSLNWNTIKNMGLVTTMRAGFSYLATLFRKLPDDNLENFYINRFGKVLYSMFFEGYTEKLWGRHPREISAEWGAQRVKGLSIRAVLADIFGKIFKVKNRKVETSLIEKFIYPKYGPGQLWTQVAEEIRTRGGKVITGASVTGITRNKVGKITSVTCSNGDKYPCDELISSMPVKDLVTAMAKVPEESVRIAEGLPYRDFQTVGLLVPNQKFLLRNNGKHPTVGDITPDCWIYVQDTSVTLGRLQVFNNWSPYMVKDLENTVWMGLEYFNDEGDKYWEMSDEDFTRFAIEELIRIGVIASKDDVIHSHREHVKKAYPAYFDTHAEFDELRAFLDTIDNLYCVGRNGQHRYNNMDHSMVTAFEAVSNILSGTTDNSNIWDVNTDQEYHEEK
ncbi:MAG: NAD(P)/FAD-dependent oxidoreductase [Propionibacteriaceae bacterium]|jgi:protoporphyrinogen oxidase|nr:NAD(P)/FAD-dependent oxidoreductase [Propionibacteriaceae bacterium]